MKNAVGGIFLVVVLALMCLAVGWCAFTKSEASTATPNIRCFYRGLGLFHGVGLLGKVYYKVMYSDDSGYFIVKLGNRNSYNTFSGYYPDGRLRESGQMFVDDISLHHQPFPHRNRMKEGLFYRYDGAIASRITMGTGIQTYWTTNGIKIWELELRNSEMVSLKSWSSDGRPILNTNYVGQTK